MQKRYIVIIIMFSIVFKIFAIGSPNKTLEIVFKNRAYLKGKLTGDLSPAESLFVSYAHKDYSSWLINKKEVLDVFRMSCRRMDKGYLYNNLFGDSIIISILINNLIDGYVEYSYKTLMTSTSFRTLRKYSENIKHVLSISNISKKKKNEMLGFTNLTQEDRKQLLNDTLTPLYVKARLGKNEAINSLKKQFLNEKSYERKKELIIQLIRTEREECLKFVIANFNDTTYKYVNRCRDESLKYPIIKEFKRIHPNENIFVDELDEVYDFFRSITIPNHEQLQTVIADYLDRVTKYFESKYGVKPKIPLNYDPFLYGMCANID